VTTYAGAPSLHDGVREDWLTSLALNATFDRPCVEAATACAAPSAGAQP
jgi:hypothetical protein